MKQPNETPEAVTAGLKRYCEQHSIDPKSIDLQWDSLNGCYCFTRNGMYHGIELNGYVHT